MTGADDLEALFADLVARQSEPVSDEEAAEIAAAELRAMRTERMAPRCPQTERQA